MSSRLNWTGCLVGLAVSGITFLAFALTPSHVSGDATPMDIFKKACDQPMALAEFLHDKPLTRNLKEAAQRIPDALKGIGIKVAATPAEEKIRIGARIRSIEGQVSWSHFEGAGMRPWIDIVEFESTEACETAFKKKKQWYSGRNSPDYRMFMTHKSKDGLDAVSTIIKRGNFLFNFGYAIPFKFDFSPKEHVNTAEEWEYVGASIDSLAMTMEAVARTLVHPEAIVWIPPAIPDKDDVRLMRLAGFARLWSEVKYNFAFFEKRPNLDWDSVLELYLPRIDAARTQEEYTKILQECVALLQDGHTWVGGGRSGDTPLLNMEPLGGKPVVTAVGETPEMQASGVKAGMTLVAVNGIPVEEMLEKDIYPYVFASTRQDRDVKAFRRLLEAEPDSTISATFLDVSGKMHSVDLVCDLREHRDAAPWTRRSGPFEHRELSNDILYMAVNTFGTEKVVELFDAQFDSVLASKGLIIDVRNNSGGSSGNGYAIVARLIDKPCATSKWRTRMYKPSYQAWGREEEWFEGEHGAIEPRGEKPFSGPVVVLIGPKTYSAAEDFLVPLKASGRATLIGEPTGGSTGQPLFVNVYGASAGICTKWDRFPDGTDFVGVGVQPDIPVARTKADVAGGRDPALESAIAFLKQKK